MLSHPPVAPTRRAKLKQLLSKQLLQSIRLTAEMSQKVLPDLWLPFPKPALQGGGELSLRC